MKKHSKNQSTKKFICFITEIAHYISSLSKEVANDLGFPLNLIKTLSKIHENENITLNQLSYKLSMDKGNLSRILNELEKRFLINKTNDIYDRRKQYIFITKKGLELLMKYENIYNEKITYLLVNIDISELEYLLINLNKLHMNIKDDV